MQPAVQTQTFNTSDGCAIAYALRGTSKPGAPRVVLIHSLALDQSIWDNVVAKLANDVQILTYDCRGHGRSGKPHMDYTVDLFARDLAELLDRVGWQSAAVAGCSMGGCVAQAFGALYPSRARALALIDTIAWYGEDASKTWRERAAKARAKGLGGMVDFQISRWFGDRFRKEHADAVKALIDVFLANDLECYAATCVLLGDADLRFTTEIDAYAGCRGRGRRRLRHSGRRRSIPERKHPTIHLDRHSRRSASDARRMCR